MIIVITPEKTARNEPVLINKMFKKGLALLHIRKYKMGEDEMKEYIEGIHKTYRKQLVLHSHFHMAKTMKIERLHFREEDRMQNRQDAFADEYIFSTSVHSVNDHNTLPARWNYAFISPVFPSISKKGYGVEHNVLEDIRSKSNNAVRLIGLGGINADNYKQVSEAGAEGVALLGCIWLSSDPVRTFERFSDDRK